MEKLQKRAKKTFLLAHFFIESLKNLLVHHTYKFQVECLSRSEDAAFSNTGGVGIFTLCITGCPGSTHIYLVSSQ